MQKNLTIAPPVEAGATELSVMGLDVSLSATGVSINGHPQTVSGGSMRGVGRMIYIRDMLVDLFGLVDAIAIEAPAFAAKGSYSKEIGGIWWVVRIAIAEHSGGALVAEIPPTSAKKYATGSGNASKDLMLVEAVKRLGYEGSSNNEADALWLEQIGRELFVDNHTPLVPASHRKALDKLRIR